jgi:hypothetical protein
MGKRDRLRGSRTREAVSSREKPRNHSIALTKPFPSSAKTPGNQGLVSHPPIKQGGSIMWDIIINLIYHQSCRKCLAAARKQSALDHLWA